MNQIHFIGYSAVHPADFTYRFSLENCYLLLLTSTPAEFFINGKIVRSPANSAILYQPGQTAQYRACDKTYQNDWIRFSSTETFVSQFPLKGIPFSVSDPEYCHHLFQLLTWESTTQTASSELILTQLLQILFLKLRSDSQNSREFQHVKELQALRKNIANMPQYNWNVPDMAAELHISTGHLHLIYRNLFGTTCMKDVIDGRIRLAKEMLLYTSCAIYDISEACGFRNVEHFCRLFKKMTAQSPSNFRKSFASPAANPQAKIQYSAAQRPNKWEPE